MDDEAIQELITAATKAADYAEGVRAMHRKRSMRGNRQRELDLSLALNRLARAMRPIRSELARAPYGKPGCVTPLQRKGLAEASQIVQRERRKLWKMQKHEKPRRRRTK